jgi:hypothetical protein
MTKQAGWLEHDSLIQLHATGMIACQRTRPGAPNYRSGGLQSRRPSFIMLPTAMQVFEIEAQSATNRLWIHFRGRVSPQSLAEKSAEAEKHIASLARGFTVIADLSELDEMEIDCVPHVTHLMDAFLKAGVGQVIRVIPDASKDIGLTLLSLTHYRGRVPIRTIESRAELSGAM